MDLRGKVALITGASRGVGAATAVALADAGCAVACAARSTQANPQRTAGTLEETVGRIRERGGDAIAVPTNLAVEDEVVAMVRATAEHFGRIDVLVNNAAVTFVGDLGIPLHRHDLTMAINARAPFVAIREVVPHMEKSGGAIVNVSSAAALYPYPDNMSYGMSKVALERLSVDAARQLYRKNIAVNCFRIDLPVASEGFVANTNVDDLSTWEPCEVPAEGIRWMLEQPMPYSGRRESMYALREREGIMRTRAKRPSELTPPQELINELAPDRASTYKEPYAPTS
ncbi:SDR family NAD(P)-dependent oxidoreductase [Amycolatopsis sp. GM8]|uniref:SDR family NAD(P)-dependent oxidoreductase n=1 Tax=Amycolatopsis sp. GM8 TaxID=2896530 RepID=UPI001F302342|nr:SDR family NAD(P)-dependent oxidoreductase [Amycolatopsis sp. GM8]